MFIKITSESYRFRDRHHEKSGAKGRREGAHAICTQTVIQSAAKLSMILSKFNCIFEERACIFCASGGENKYFRLGANFGFLREPP